MWTEASRALRDRPLGRPEGTFRYGAGSSLGDRNTGATSTLQSCEAAGLVCARRGVVVVGDASGLLRATGIS